MFAFHAQFVLPHLLPAAVRRLVIAGAPSAVSFFFVLSGFVLVWGLPPASSAGRFLWRRAFRLVPMYLLAWVLALAMVDWSGHVVPTGAAWASVLLVQAWVPHVNVVLAVNPVGWSLSCEVFFSALLPLLLPLLVRLPRALRRLLLVLLPLTALLVAATAGSGDAGTYVVAYDPLVRLTEFAAGMLGALELRAGLFRVPLAPAAALLAVALAVTPHVPSVYRWAAVTFVPYVLLILAAAQGDLGRVGGISAMLRSRWLLRGGSWSYAFYLLHVPVGFLLLRTLGATALQRHSWLALASWFFLAGGLSALAHHLVEAPLYRWAGRRGPGAANADAPRRRRST